MRISVAVMYDDGQARLSGVLVPGVLNIFDCNILSHSLPSRGSNGYLHLSAPSKDKINGRMVWELGVVTN